MEIKEALEHLTTEQQEEITRFAAGLLAKQKNEENHREAMKAVFVGGALNGQTMTTDEIYIAGHWNGKFSRSWRKEREEGRITPRPELWNQPLVDGYLSPMWDGDGLRYETQEVYDILSR